MSANRAEKERVVAELQEKFSEAASTILTDYRGLSVAESTELRKRLREAGVEYKVVKNTLGRLAAKDAGHDGLNDYLVGPTAIAFAFDDPVAPAKILAGFMKEFKKVQFKAGLLRGQLIDQDQFQELADLPSREELLAKVVGGMQAPIAGFNNVLAGMLRGLVYSVEDLRKKKEAGEVA